MKKNKALTAAISVLSLTMVSLCAIGGTFAKYVSNGSATDTAHVAKWGVELRVTGNDAFAEEYDVNALAGSETVVSVNAAINGAEEDNVLAPGTNGELGGVEIDGAPEVSVKLDVSLELKLEGWEIETPVDEVYCPLIFTVTVGSTETVVKWGSNSVDLDGDDAADDPDDVINSIEKFQNAVALLVNHSETYVPNTDLSVVYEDVTIDWRWDFQKPELVADVNAKETDMNTKKGLYDDAVDALENNSEPSQTATLTTNRDNAKTAYDDAKAEYDAAVAALALENAKDTALGDLAEEGHAPTITATWSVSVEQVD